MHEVGCFLRAGHISFTQMITSDNKFVLGGVAKLGNRGSCVFKTRVRLIGIKIGFE